MGRGDPSDDQWSVLEPLLPTAGVGRPARNQRRLINGVRWRVRTGVPWRDLLRPSTGTGRPCTGCSGAGSARVYGPGY
ncbi:transposase [Streptomyces sp. S1D4-11]